MQERMTITDVNTLAQRLKEAREALGLSQEQLAQLAGVSQGTIGNIESGTRKRPREIVAIAKAVKVNPEWLLKGIGLRNSSEGKGGNYTQDSFIDTHLSRAPVVEWGELGEKLKQPNYLTAHEEALDFLASGQVSFCCKLLKITDDALAPRLRPGDYVAIDPSNVNPKRDQVILVHSALDGSYFLRRFRPISGGRFEAYATGPDDSLFSDRDTLTIMGVACGVRLNDI